MPPLSPVICTIVFLRLMAPVVFGSFFCEPEPCAHTKQLQDLCSYIQDSLVSKSILVIFKQIVEDQVKKFLVQCSVIAVLSP